MIVQRLALENFRNYDHGQWEFHEKLNILYGQNGQGKTNIIESLYYTSIGSSHRTSQEGDLIKNGADHMSVRVILQKAAENIKITIDKPARQAKKAINVNGETVKPRELIGQFKATIFSPEELRLIKDEPYLRRRFLDIQIAQVSADYCFSLARYNKIIQQRNKLLALLKDGLADRDEIYAWDGQLITEAARIVRARISWIGRLSALTAAVYKQLTGQGQDVQSIYKCRGYEYEEGAADGYQTWYERALKDRINSDIEQKATGLGPHRDDLFFILNGLSARHFASQGEQRTLVLALKIAEIQLIYEESGEYPVFLLDDVMSELDAVRRQKLLGFLDGRVQTFITVTDKDSLYPCTAAHFYRVDNGVLIGDAHGRD